MTSYPSPSDAGWLSFFPFAYVAVVLLVRARVPRFYASVWLDGVVGGVGAGAIAAALAFQTVLDTTGGTTAAVAVNLAYPIGDLLLLVLVVGVLALLGWRPDRTGPGGCWPPACSCTGSPTPSTCSWWRPTPTGRASRSTPAT